MRPPFIIPLVVEFRRNDKYAMYSQKDRYGDKFEIILKYSNLYMEIRNLQEISPYIRISRSPPENIEQSPIFSPVEGSDNGVEWKALEDDEIAESFQIYRVFDPVFILPQCEFESESAESGKYLEGYYNVEHLRLPTSIKKLFGENEENIRKIGIRYYLSPPPSPPYHQLYAMTQNDFPPFTEAISLTFSSDYP